MANSADIATEAQLARLKIPAKQRSLWRKLYWRFRRQSNPAFPEDNRHALAWNCACEAIWVINET